MALCEEEPASLRANELAASAAKVTNPAHAAILGGRDAKCLYSPQNRNQRDSRTMAGTTSVALGLLALIVDPRRKSRAIMASGALPDHQLHRAGSAAFHGRAVPPPRKREPHEEEHRRGSGAGSRRLHHYARTREDLREGERPDQASCPIVPVHRVAGSSDGMSVPC